MININHYHYTIPWLQYQKETNMHVLSVPVSLHLKLQYHYINMHDHDVTVNVDISSMHCNTLHQCHCQYHNIGMHVTGSVARFSPI